MRIVHLAHLSNWSRALPTILMLTLGWSGASQASTPGGGVGRSDAAASRSAAASEPRGTDDSAPASTTTRKGGSQTASSSGSSTSGADKKEASNLPVLVYDSGVLTNNPHKFHFPVPLGWKLSPSSTADEMVFSSPGCSDCVLRVLVNPGGAAPLMETVQSVKDQIEKGGGGARLIGEEPIKVAHEEAYTLVKEEPKGAKSQAPPPDAAHSSDDSGSEPDTVKTRYVIFDHAGDQYILVLRAPKDRFGDDDAAFDSLLGKLRFTGFLGGLFKKN